ncbi:hypothetical protein BDV98DRAFT_584572 [Pterulicium gracile]|uniref:Uncharacterized protein n=1 Tax=Pterulicium gracile TaxID=1884261 RepID=A0A5C3QB79_9AGAR|nr:hypothetical protein BDV98DRAFT_584572 [Pterula gracilis]
MHGSIIRDAKQACVRLKTRPFKNVLSSAPPPGLEPHRKFDGKVSTANLTLADSNEGLKTTDTTTTLDGWQVMFGCEGEYFTGTCWWIHTHQFGEIYATTFLLLPITISPVLGDRSRFEYDCADELPGHVWYYSRLDWVSPPYSKNISSIRCVEWMG